MQRSTSSRNALVIPAGLRKAERPRSPEFARARAISLISSKPARATCKIALVAALLGVLLGIVITYVSREAVNELRRHLTLWLILVIAAVINIVSFALFSAFWAIYRWIKRDLDAEADDQDGLR